MAIIQRQKDIVNPFAQRYSSTERNGVGYDYRGRRNRFVIAAIHDSYRNLGLFPEIGTVMTRVGPLYTLRSQERTLTEKDALAYCALYPQNAKIVGGKFKLLSDDEIYQELKKIANILASEQVSESYETVTTSEAQFIENQTIVPSNTGREQITYNSQEEQTEAARKQTIARLISIPPVHSAKYINYLRKSLGMPESSYEIEDNLYLYSKSGLIPYTSQNSNVDLYDWRNNADPGTETTKVYYNPIDDNYYFVVRTNSLGPKDYVVALGGNWSPNENTVPNLKKLLGDGVDEILKFTQKYSYENRAVFVDGVPTQQQVLLAMVRGSSLEDNDKLSLLTYMDERPSSPWVGCVKIPRVQIDTLSGGFEVSYEEFEMTPFEKSRVLVGENKPSYRLPIQVNSLIGKLAATKKVLKRYLRDIIIENIPKKLIKNVDIEREIDNLHNFINYLQLLYNYNRIPLDDDDIIEFYLSDTFRLMYMAINGNLITRGIGNGDFIRGNADDVIILDAFGLMSQTSFSFLFYSPYIFKEYLEKPDASGRSWVDFLGTYMYPPLDMTALSTQIQANKKKNAEILNQKRQQNVFQKLSDISRIPSQSIEEMYFKRPIRYRLENLENNIQCGTAQARYAKYALGIAKAFTTQTKIKSITRQVILILKNEIISDAVKRAKISIDGQEVGLQDAEDLGFRYADNPELIRRDIEKYVNERIFCSLDAIGDFIEDSFLDPIGAPPAANDLVRATLDPPIKFEFKERPSFSLVDGRRKAYEKIVSAIIENFLNALLAGIVRDLINAFLGCGPNTAPEDAEQLKNSAAQINYGGVEIREFLSDTDIVQKASEAGLVSDSPDGKVEVTFEQMSNFLDDVSKIVTPAEATALLRGDAPGYLYQVILEMISRTQPIPIPRDTEILTESYKAINFDSDNLNVYFELLGAGNPTTEAYSSINPVESYCDDRDVQASDLGLDFLPEEQLIVQLDEAVKNKMLKLSFFCDFLRNALDFQAELDKLMDLIPSMGWYDDLLDSIAEFSNWLAEQAADLFSDSATNQVPAPNGDLNNFYTTKFGNQAFWGVYRNFLTTTTVANTPRTDLDKGFWLQTLETPASSYSVMAQQSNGERYSWVDKFGMPDAQRIQWLKLNTPGYANWRTDTAVVANADTTQYSQTYGTPEQIDAARRDEQPGYWEALQANWSNPKIALVFRGTFPTEEQMRERTIKNAGIGYSIVDISKKLTMEEQLRIRLEERVLPGAVDDEADLGGPLLASDPLTGREQTLDLFGQFEQAAPDLNYFTLASFFMDNLAYRNIAAGEDFENGILKIDTSNRTMRNTRNQFAWNINAYGNAVGGPDRTANYPAQSYKKLDRNLLTFGNPYRLNEKTTEAFYTIPEAQRRLPGFVRSVNKFPFDLAGDECVTPEEELIASSIISSIQARVARFLFNSGPLMTVYPYWGSDATIYMLSDYLLRKMEVEYTSRKLLGVIYDKLKIVEKAYSNPSEELNRGFRLYKNRTPRENLRVLIRCLLFKMLDNIAAGSEYSSVNQSLFSDSHGGLARFNLLFLSYLDRMIEYYNAFPNEQELKKYQYLKELGSGPAGDAAQFLQAGYYFFPLAHLYAAYIITWDVANISRAIKDLDFQLKSQAAQTDDTILTALNGTLSNQFGSNFAGFPITVTSYNDITITYYSKEEVSARLAFLEEELQRQRAPEAPDFGIEELEDLYFRGNEYYTTNPADAPQDYVDTITAWLVFAGDYPRGFGIYTHAGDEDVNTQTIYWQTIIMSNRYFASLLREAYINGTVRVSLAEICLYDKYQLNQFFVDTLGFGAVETVNTIWNSENFTGRGEDRTPSEAATVNLLRDLLYARMQKLCAVLSAPDLRTAALAMGLVSEDEVESEEGRLAIIIASIQSEINTLSRYI